MIVVVVDVVDVVLDVVVVDVVVDVVVVDFVLDDVVVNVVVFSTTLAPDLPLGDLMRPNLGLFQSWPS